MKLLQLIKVEKVNIKQLVTVDVKLTVNNNLYGTSHQGKIYGFFFFWLKITLEFSIALCGTVPA